MQIVINGGVYRVVFKGTHDSEFKGEHPALVIRTLKEHEIFMVIPLTTYTPEKMEQVRRMGFGIRIQSTNSIARIDKYQIIHRNNIKNRWKDGNKSIKIEPNEVVKLNERIEQYVKLSNEKAYKEYKKYCNQYERILMCLSDICKNQVNEDNIFTVIEKEDGKIIKCKKSDAYWLSMTDLNEIVKHFYNSNATVNIKDDFIIINIKLRVKLS